MTLTQEQLNNYLSGVRQVRNIILEWSDQFLNQTDRFTSAELEQVKTWRQALRNATQGDTSFIKELPYPVIDMIPDMPDFLIKHAVGVPFVDAAIPRAYLEERAKNASPYIDDVPKFQNIDK